MKNILKIIAMNFMVLSTLVISVELLGQLVHLAKNGNLLPFATVSAHHQLFEIHPYLAARPRSSVEVTSNKKAITTTKSNTRWTGARQDDNDLIRIAILGGSTVFGSGVSDEDSWPRLLQGKLGDQYAVINYGVPGYSTAENIVQMALLVPEQQPHIVIFYEGWNDIRHYHENALGSDYYAHGVRQFGNLGIPVFERQYQFQSLRNVFAIAWLLDKLREKLANPAGKTFQTFDKPDPFVDEIYLRNLKTLRALAENIDAFAVFVPQVLNYADYRGKKGSRAWTRHINDSAMPALMDRFNSIMNGLCPQQKYNCVVFNEVLKNNWLPDDFVDDGHLSKKGGVKISEAIYQSIIQGKFERKSPELGLEQNNESLINR